MTVCRRPCVSSSTTTGVITETPGAEPLAADIRPGADDRRSALLKIAAGMLGVPLDRLVQRDNARRHRRLIQVATAALAGCLAFAVISVVAVQSRNEAERQRRLAVQQSLTAQRTADFHKSLFAVSDPSEARGQSITAREVLDRGRQQIEFQLHDEPAVRAELMTTLGEVYGSLGMLREGLGLGGARAGVALAARGAYCAAVDRDRRLQIQQGNLDAAKASLERARNLPRTCSPATARSTCASKIHSASCTGVRTTAQRARTAYREALRHPRTRTLPAPTAGSRPRRVSPNATWTRAISPPRRSGFRRALERQIAATGELHPRAAELLNELGSLKYFEGDRASAAQYFERTLRIDQQVLGDKHPTVTITTNNLARILLEQRRFAEARALLEPSARTFSSQVLATEPDMTFVLSNLALIEMEQGNYEAAQIDFDGALRTAIVNKHRLHGPILTDLADLECRTGRADAGLAHLAQAQPIVAARYPDDAWRLAQIDNVRAGCLVRLKRYPEAEPLVASSMPVLLNKWPPDTLYGHDALQRSIQLYQATGSQAKLAHYRLLAEKKVGADPVSR